VLNVYVASLRKKIGAQRIETVRGVGYRLRRIAVEAVSATPPALVPEPGAEGSAAPAPESRAEPVVPVGDSYAEVAAPSREPSPEEAAVPGSESPAQSLGRALEAAGYGPEIVHLARSGYWSESETPLAEPKTALVNMLRRDGHEELALRVLGGEFGP
jgi:hypothetical protein